MKFKIQSKTFLSKLSAVSKVVNSKNVLSILDNFLFQLEGDTLTVTASDAENTIISRISVDDAEGQGSFAVNVKYILEALKCLPDQILSFDINDDNLEININYRNGNFNFIAVNAAEFPQKESIENEGESTTIMVPAKEIAKGISKTIFAVAVNEDMRPQMMGIYWDIKPDSIIFVASDTHKLARYINKNITTGVERSFIMPTKPASLLQNFLPNDDSQVKVVINDNGAYFETDSFSLNCRFIKGSYPNYASVIPTNNPFTLTIDRECILNAVRRVSVFASVGGLVKFELSLDTIQLRSQDIDFSTSAQEAVSCDYKGESMIIGFNDGHLIELFANINSDNIVLQLSDPSRACVFLPDEQDENEDFLVLLMPMYI